MSTARTICSLQMDGPTVARATSSTTSPTGIVAPCNCNDPDDADYQQHAIHIQSGNPDEDFEACFLTPSVKSVSIPAATDPSLPTADSVLMIKVPAMSDEFLLRCLAATQDEHSSSCLHMQTMGLWHVQPMPLIFSSCIAPSPLMPPSVSMLPVTTLIAPLVSVSRHPD